MTMTDHPRYELFYWPHIPGRGEFIRLMFEDAGVAYVDVVRWPAAEGGGIERMLAYAFPRNYGRVATTYPRLRALREEVRTRPRLAAYLASSRRVPFGDGLFRHYPELDLPAEDG